MCFKSNENPFDYLDGQVLTYGGYSPHKARPHPGQSTCKIPNRFYTLAVWAEKGEILPDLISWQEFTFWNQSNRSNRSTPILGGRGQTNSLFSHFHDILCIKIWQFIESGVLRKEVWPIFSKKTFKTIDYYKVIFENCATNHIEYENVRVNYPFTSTISLHHRQTVSKRGTGLFYTTIFWNECVLPHIIYQMETPFVQRTPLSILFSISIHKSYITRKCHFKKSRAIQPEFKPYISARLAKLKLPPLLAVGAPQAQARVPESHPPRAEIDYITTFLKETNVFDPFHLHRTWSC